MADSRLALASEPAAGFVIEIPGVPRPKKRPRSGQGRTFTPAETREAEEAVRAAWILAGRPYVPGTFMMHATFMFSRPARSRAKAPGTADVDNLLKLALDALNGFAFDDDRLLVDVRAVKAWAPEPASRIEVRPAVV